MRYSRKKVKEGGLKIHFSEKATETSSFFTLRLEIPDNTKAYPCTFTDKQQFIDR